MTPPEQTQTPPPAVGDDPFKYGWRYVKRTRPDGSVELDQVPLTLEDVLHPQEDDFIVQSTLHRLEWNYLVTVLETRPLHPPLTLVTGDLLIDWGIPDLRGHGPDVAVFVGMRTHPEPTSGTLHLAETGGRCIFVAEITSPSTRSNDVGPKFDHYHRVGIPLYVLVDQQAEDGPRTLQGYRRTRKAYAPLGLDGQGRLLLEPFGLWLKLVENRLVCQDVATGRDYPPLSQHVSGLEEADRKLQEQAQSLEESIEARLAAERKAKKAAKARRAAHRRAQEAQRDAEKEREARLALEEKVRQLEARLRNSHN